MTSVDPLDVSLLRRARTFARVTSPPRTALVTPAGTFTYGDLLAASAAVARALLDAAEVSDLAQAPVPFLLPPSFEYVAAQWGIQRAGGVAVPLATVHPPRELAYVLDDTQASLVLGGGRGDAAGELDAKLRPLADERGASFLGLAAILEDGGAAPAGEASAAADDMLDRDAPDRDASDRGALMAYTSGTTGRPKGVVTTHGNLEAQITTLVDAWGWRAEDRILHVLPLHHVHGIVNVLSCALWSGAVCEVMPAFDATAVWERFASGEITLFMAVPTIYQRLLAAWEEAPAATRERRSAGARRLRLMVSGSAALPVPVLERWREITGQVLLERYGMTEIGMALSNPLQGERRPGTVGRPLPGVQVRRRGEDGRLLDADEDAVPGELEVRGPSVFRQYWRRPEATAEAFRPGGWFCTGDVAVIESGYYRLLGRQSVDILKTGGYKISALEIEEVLRTHPAVADCAVVGVPDAEWGERVAAAVVPRAGASPPELDDLRAWGKERLAPYKVPSLLRCLPELPRNALGKVTKPAVAELFTTDDST